MVLGASGGTGRAVVDELLRQGQDVRAVVRSARDLPAGVETVAATSSTPSRLGAPSPARRSCTTPHSPRTTSGARQLARLNDSVARAAGPRGARLVFADNLYIYGPGASPMTELPAGRHRSEGEPSPRPGGRPPRAPRAGRGGGGARPVVGLLRAARAELGLGERLFGAAVAGKAASWGGALDQPHSTSYLPDLARAMVVLGDRDEAAGRAWHLPVMDPVTGREFGERLFAVLGRSGKLQPTTGLLLLVGGLFMPIAREARVVHYQWQAPWISDWSAFEAAFGPFERTPLDEAIRTTAAWWAEQARAGEKAA
ncbi:MAG: NAD(P)H-binding protein [Chloroflexota bacterium]